MLTMIRRWRKSTHSNPNGACVEVGQDPQLVLLRDAKDPGGPVLAFAPAVFATFTATQKGIDP